MSERATVLVLGRRKTDNMPSLTRMLEITRPEQQIIDVTGIDRRGMDATLRDSVRITGANTIYPVMADPGEDECVWGCEEVDESDPEN